MCGVSDLPRLRELGERYGGGKVIAVAQGGAERQQSVAAGLLGCWDFEYIAVHDAARPCITPELIAQSITAAKEHGAATVAVRLSDTLVRGPKGVIEAYVPRDGLWRVQTPQVFRRELLEEAHRSAKEHEIRATDDAGLVRRLGQTVHIVPGSPENLKVTEAADLAVAEAVVSGRWSVVGEAVSGIDGRILSPGAEGINSLAQGQGLHRPSDEEETSTMALPSSEAVSRVREDAMSNAHERGDLFPRPHGSRTTSEVPSPPPTTDYRIGHGYDVHPFAEGRRLFLGGVEFPEATRGLLGHSDADVVLHAVCDAVLGAAGLGDIGHFFPPSDPAHKDRRSTEFLAEVAARVRADGWQVANVDVTILAETPKIGPKADAMKREIAVLLSIDPARVGIKATTNEGLGFIGRGEGIAVHATTLLYRL
jgi:2-C-methyl-D-erythritol 2,4-cyclodiphosphate synthase/2-C-methyl-D-erythritol 4-phosphate cytidylyltransferase